MIVVIADDITGAAEIAGIGLRFGMQVKLVTSTHHTPRNCDLMVYATNSRSMSESEAIAIHTQLAQQINAAGCRRIYKKTDSALRGHLIAEVRPFLQYAKLKHVLFVPQNPSKGRVIEQGIYYINGQPLHETTFRNDPEFPAPTSDVVQLLNREAYLLNPGRNVYTHPFYIANASDEDEIGQYASQLNENILPAGGADFFVAYLKSNGYTEKKTPSTFGGLQNRDALIICGSTVKHDLSAFGYIQRKAMPVNKMPAKVFEGTETPDCWIEQLKENYMRHRSLLLTIGHPPRTGKEFASQLNAIITRAAIALLNEQLPQELIIEGGATAYSIVNALRCEEFVVQEEIAPGVIRIASQSIPNCYITIKPGSYSWGTTLD